MGVSTHDIFGDAEGTQLATPGSYGEAPRGGCGAHVGEHGDRRDQRPAVALGEVFVRPVIHHSGDRHGKAA